MCCNPANGRVEFWEQLAFKSSFITKNKMKACQLTRTKIQQKCNVLIVVIQLRRNPKLSPALISTLRISHCVISGKKFPCFESKYFKWNHWIKCCFLYYCRWELCLLIGVFLHHSPSGISGRFGGGAWAEIGPDLVKMTQLFLTKCFIDNFISFK
jgi:hypothetical protein